MLTFRNYLLIIVTFGKITVMPRRVSFLKRLSVTVIILKPVVITFVLSLVQDILCKRITAP